MSGRTRAFLAIGAVVALWHIYPVAQVAANSTTPGAQWLSWNTKERDTYVSGFVDGYKTGTTQICASADEFFGVKNQSLGDQNSESASAACFAHRGDYSRQYSGAASVDFSAYAIVVTDFYTRHPDYRMIPFSRLMLSLRDGASTNAAQLYSRAQQGELR